MNRSTINLTEKNKFAHHAVTWWDKNGPLKTLHDINPIRIQYIEKFCHLKDKHILDVGCGGGILSEALALKGGIVTGVDIVEESIEIAQKHALHRNIPNLNYLCQPIEACEGEYDLITCLEMLEHVDDPSLVIHHMERLLKPGGIMILSTINRTVSAYTSVILAAEYILNILPRQTHDFQKFIKPSELARSLRQFNLAVLDVQGLTYNPFTRHTDFCASPSVNYLLAACKS